MQSTTFAIFNAVFTNPLRSGEFGGRNSVVKIRPLAARMSERRVNEMRLMIFLQDLLL